MGEYFVHSEQMTVGYDGKPLIRDIEIRLNRGEILTLIGPNGAGKTTIFNLLTGVYKPTEGIIKLNNIEESYQTAKAGRRNCVSGSETDESDVRQGSRTEAGRCNDGENKTRAYDM